MSKKLKKTMAAVLAGALVFSMLPAAGPKTVEAVELPKPTAHYDMSHSENQLTDKSGNGKNATLYGTADSNFKSSGNTNILQFAGGQYAELPQGLVTESDNDFTVEITLSAQTQGNYWAWVLGQGVGKWGEHTIGDYVFMGPKSDQNGYKGNILSSIKVGDESARGEKRMPASSKSLGAGYSTITLVSDDNTITVYLDGEQVSQGTHEYNSIASIIPDEGPIGYIGKSLYEDDPLLTANVGDIKFYDEALTQDQVEESMPTAEEKEAMQAAEDGTDEPGGSSDAQLIAAYDMSHEGDVLKDTTNNGNDAVIHGAEEGDFLTNGDENVWQLHGESYATLPGSIKTDLGTSQDFTVQATLTTQTPAVHWLFAIGDGFGTWNEKNVGDYIFVNPSASEKGGNFLAAIKTGTGNDWKETRLPDSSTGMDDVNGYGTVTLTGEGGNLKLYLDGTLVSSTTNQDKTIQDVLPDGNMFGYIGRSLYTGDALLTANLAEFKIYSGALTAQEIKDSLPKAEDKSNMLMADILETVKGENASLDAVTEDINLPSSIDNVSIKWGRWSQTDVIDTDGTVIQPADNQAEVKIPFSYEIDGTTYNKEITVTVLQLDVDAELKEALDSIDIPNKDDVRGNITLPKESENGIAIEWSTDHPGIVNVNEISEKVAGYGATPAGTVTRPKEDTKVTMTAKITLNGESKEKRIELTVKAAPEEIEESDYTDYFFAYFAGEGYSNGEQIYFASSQDGLNWDDLNNNQPVLTSTLGEKGVRDPFIIRSPEGDKFYLIATDLKINGGNGWGAAQTNGSQSLMVWESTDLVNWSDQRMVEVSAGIEAGCTWAPEATYDPLTGEYVVYWASKTSADNYSKQIVYYSKTRDFYTFTDPQKFVEKDQSSIDTTIIYDEDSDKYYRYTKNEAEATNQDGTIKKTIFVESSDTLLGDYTFIQSDSLNNKDNQWVEGPTIFKFNEDDRTNGAYCLLVDDFSGIGYYPLVTNDLSTGSFSQPSVEFKMPSRARHGTPIRVTAEEYQRIMDAYATPEEVNTVTYAGETPDLPETVTIDNGYEQVQKNVTWNLSGVSFDGEAFSSVTVTGAIEDSQLEAVANVRIIPKNIEYMIDCNNSGSGTWTGAKSLNSALLNSEAADQAKTAYNTWGYTSVAGSEEPADITGYSQNDINNPYTGGWWARGNKNITYQVTLPAGEHTIMLGCNGWWNVGRQMDVFYSIDGGAETKLCDLDAVASQEVSASGTITLDEESVVTLTVRKADGKDPILSWIAVSGESAEAPVDLTKLQEAVGDAEAAGYIEADYTADSWKTFSDALTYAKGILDKGTDATADEVSTALSRLASGRSGLVPANRETLVILVANANAELGETDKYTEASLANLAVYIDAAEAVLDNSASTPAQIQTAIDELNQALADLDEKEQGGQTGDGDQTGDGGQTGDGSQNGDKDNGGQNGGKDTAGQTDGNDKAVQTGDTTNLFLPAVMAVIALAAAASVIIIKKKRK